MAETVPAVGVRALVAALERLGLSAGELLADVGIDPALTRDPDGRVPTEQADALWASAYRVSGDARLAMRAVQQLRPGDYRTLTYLAAHCRTLGEGVRQVIGFFDLVDRRILWDLDEAADTVRLRLRFDGVSDPLPRPPVEYTLGAFLTSLRLTTRVEVRPLRVEVSFPDPGGDAAAEHRRVLGPMVYEAETTSVRFAGSTWRRSLPTADGALAAMLADLAARQVRELPSDDDLRTRLHRAVGSALTGGPPTLADVARSLAVSERSLQRRLSEEGTTFRDEVDAVRQVTATMLLEDPGLALSEVSWLLGFSDQRAFTRAFRRWSGTTPSAWRAGRAG